MAVKQYTERQKLCYVFLLHYLYKDDVLALQKDHGIGIASLRKWTKELLLQAQNSLFVPDSEKILLTPEEPPSVYNLYNLFLKLLESANTSKDAANYAIVVNKLYDIRKKEGEMSDEEKVELWKELNDKISGNEKSKG